MRKFHLPSTSAMLLLTLSLFSNPVFAQLQNTVALLKGDIATAEGDKISGATIAIYKGTDKVLTTHTNEEGKFTSVLHPGNTYRLTINHPNYLYSEEIVSIPESEKYLEVPFHASIKPLQDGKIYDLPQPVFMPGSTTMEQSAVDNFEEIVSTVKHNSKLTLSIMVYPDAPIKGGKKDAKADAKQQAIVLGRATAIASFFTTRGISDKSVAVTQAKTVPVGRFPQTVVVTKGKKGKPKSTTILVPQYVEIVTHLG
jgi:hypothetical protein